MSAHEVLHWHEQGIGAATGGEHDILDPWVVGNSLARCCQLRLDVVLGVGGHRLGERQGPTNRGLDFSHEQESFLRHASPRRGQVGTTVVVLRCLVHALGELFRADCAM